MNFASLPRVLGRFLLGLAVTNGGLFVGALVLRSLVHVPHVLHV